MRWEKHSLKVKRLVRLVLIGIWTGFTLRHSDLAEQVPPTDWVDYFVGHELRELNSDQVAITFWVQYDNPRERVRNKMYYNIDEIEYAFLKCINELELKFNEGDGHGSLYAKRRYENNDIVLDIGVDKGYPEVLIYATDFKKVISLIDYIDWGKIGGIEFQVDPNLMCNLLIVNYVNIKNIMCNK